MVKINKDNVNSGEIRFFVKTTKGNYIINVVITLLLTFILTSASYLRERKEGWFVLLIFVLFFFTIFRIIEYILTKKSLGYYPGFGREMVGKDALYGQIFNIFMFVLFIIAFLVRTYG